MSGRLHDHRFLEHLTLFVAASLVLLPGAFWGVPSGKAVAGALVILDGGVPYRDFWTMYAPGQFYAVAALYGLFGRELLVQGIATCLLRAGSALALFALLRRLGVAKIPAYVSVAVFVLMSWESAPELTDYPLALPFLLLALNRVVRYFGDGGIAHLRWTGLWLGIGAWFKHDVSAYIAIGVSIGLFLSHLAIPAGRPGGWVTPLRGTLAMTAVAVATIAPVAAWTGWTAGAAAWNDLFVFPATVFSKVRGDQFPPLVPDLRPLLEWFSDPTHVRRALRAVDPIATWVILYTPAGIFLAGVAVFAFLRRRLAPAAAGILVVFPACMPFFWAAAHVQQNTHPYTLAILGAGAGWIMWLSAPRSREPGKRLRTLVIATASIYAAGLMTAAAISASAVYYQWPRSRVLDLPGFQGIRLPLRLFDSYQPVGEFIRRSVPEGEPIYTGLLRHDSIVINNALLYAIAGRPTCCGYTELHPGVGDRAPVHREIIRRLERANVRAMVLWEFGWPEDVMEARKRHTVAGVPDAGSTILDRYITEHFERIAQHGEYHILWRRDAPRPSSVPAARR